MRFIKPVIAAVSFICFGASAFGACVHVGGGVITNVGVITADRTLGVSTGDIRGAVGVQIVGQSPGMNGTTVLSVHHYWVTDAGDTVMMDRKNGGSVHPWRLSYDLYTHCASDVSRRNTQGPIGSNDPDVCDNPTSHMNTRAESARSKADERNCSDNRFDETHTDLL